MDGPGEAELGEVAQLIAERNAIDERMAAIIGRPPLTGHIGEWIASAIFDIELEASAVAKAIDGKFRSGPLAGRSVNVKLYGKLESILDLTVDPALDFYVVLAGPRAPAATSRGATRPLNIVSAFLFDAKAVAADLRARGLKVGVASSVRRALWDAAEVYPASQNPLLVLDERQRQLLSLFL